MKNTLHSFRNELIRQFPLDMGISYNQTYFKRASPCTGELPIQAGYFYVNPELCDMRLVDVVEEKMDIVIERVKDTVEEPNCRFCY